jgi:hypothetical protein
LKNSRTLYNESMDDKDQYIADLEKSNEMLKAHLEDYEDNFIRKLDSLGIGKNIDIQTFCNLITLEQFVDYLSSNPNWRRVNAIGNFNGQMEYTFEFDGESDNDRYLGRRITFVVSKTASTSYDVQRAFRSFKDFWDLWISLTGGKKNIALLLDILEYKYNSERGNKHGKKGN